MVMETQMLNPSDLSVPSYQTIQTWYSVGKTAVGVGAFAVAVYKVVRWFQDIRAKDLKEIHTSVGRLEIGMKEQTVALVGELRELRSDFRTFYIPQAVQKKAPPRKNLKKPKPKAKAVQKAPARKRKAA